MQIGLDRPVALPQESAPTRLRAKHPLAIRWFHWINFPVLFLMIWSGSLILWANNVFGVTLFGHTFTKQVVTSSWLERFQQDHRLAEGMSWHFVFAWIFAINGALYVLYTLVSGAWREILPNRHSLKESFLVVLHDLRLRREAPPQKKYNGAQRIAYTLVTVMGFGSLLTGLSIYKPTQLAPLTAALGGYDAARFWHFWLTVAFLAFFLVHVVQVVRAGWNNFRSMVTGYEIAPADAPVLLEETGEVAV